MARSRPACLELWQPSPSASALLESARLLIDFAMNTDQLAPKAQKELLNLALWWATEVDGKYTTRYRSQGVIDLASTSPLPAGWWKELRHDHVQTRKNLIKRLHTGEDASTVLGDAVGCTVTRQEHAQLTRVPDDITGWSRYKQAGVAVLDMKTGKPAVPDVACDA